MAERRFVEIVVMNNVQCEENIGRLEYMNYKNLTFSNDMAGFKAWNRAFPYMMKSDILHTGFCTKDGYYLELNVIKIRDLSNTPFLGTSLRRYNDEDKDFKTVSSMSEEHQILETLFGDKIRKFCAKHNCPVRF
jgi:hypothetical protein